MKRSHRADKTGRSITGPRFAQLPHYMIDCPAWRSLSFAAVAGYIQLARLYNGANNGLLGMAVRTLANGLGCGKSTASRALEELEGKGFIGVQKVGLYGRRDASEYYLTLYRNDVTSEIPSKAFMRWTPPPTVPKTRVSVPQAGRAQQNYRLQSHRRDCEGQKQPSHSPTGGTYIHSTMGGGSAASRSAPVGSAVASEAAPHSLAVPALKKIEPVEPMPASINDGNHARRALADLNARRGRY
jgi:hypothetical protein